MTKKFYIDTAIWMDLYENRKGYNGEPLGTYAVRLFLTILKNHDSIIITDLLITELEENYSLSEINGMISPYKHLIEKIKVSDQQIFHGKNISNIRKVPRGDAIHAIVARDHDLILITRNNHFRKLIDISAFYKPEDIT